MITGAVHSGCTAGAMARRVTEGRVGEALHGPAASGGWGRLSGVPWIWGGAAGQVRA